MIHMWLYRRSRAYRWFHGWRVMWGLHRLHGYGVIEAVVSIAANRICGHRMYWHPKATRERMRGAHDKPA